MSRYIAAGKEHCEHGCCYDAVVLDTQDKTKWREQGQIVCECPDMETAELIAEALNEKVSP